MTTNSATANDCLPSCGCRATTPTGALAGALGLMGHVRAGSDPKEAALQVEYLLRDYGWKIVRDV